MTATNMTVPYNYLNRAFPRPPNGEFRGGNNRVQDIFHDMYHLVETGDYTLGKAVQRFEEAWAKKLGVKHAIGVSNGTDALFLAMKALGIGPGDDVVTAPNSFLATAGAIAQTGANVCFADVDETYNLDMRKANPGVHYFSPKAVLPVHLTGAPTSDVSSAKHGTSLVIEDACQAVGSTRAGKPAGGIGMAAAFSLHPLKNIQTWCDGGVVTTNNDAVAEQVRLLRNHGLQDRDTCVVRGYNHRISTMASIVAYHVLKDLDWISNMRVVNAARYDEGLRDVPQITIPPRPPDVYQVYHTYVVQVENRDALLAWLDARGVEAKVHYRIPIHLQPGYAYLGYEKGDFPVAEAQAERIITLPVHEYLTNDQIDYTIEQVRAFYE